MDYLIIHNNELIGRVVEPGADRSMGVIGGPFVPFPAYENVRSVFQIYAELINTGQTCKEKLEQYYEMRNIITRHLSITTTAGLPVKIIWIDIEDFSAYLGDEGYYGHFCVDYDDGTFFSNTSLWDRKKEKSSD